MIYTLVQRLGLYFTGFSKRFKLNLTEEQQENKVNLSAIYQTIVFYLN